MLRVAPSIGKEGRKKADVALLGAFDVSGDSRCVLAPAELLGEELDVEADPARVADQVLGAQGVLVAEKEIVHLPGLAVRAAASAASAAR